ncbi:putative Insecticidal crystal toxin domain-containing protein [Seiridium unicorne]|uniref:Insecticidal crystal toxin domain-containing protein n=1 Tax=Seiridium unicorne TaxID=138068 RepID=A0ABR2UM39_9PEZI
MDSHSADWSVVRGSLVVYKQIEWVPSVIKVKTLPKSKAKETYERKIAKVDTEKLFGGVSDFVKTSAKVGGSLLGVKLEVETELKVDAFKWEIGDTVIFEVAAAMLLRVEEIYVHSMDLSLRNSASENGLTWTGGKDWSEIAVNNRDLTEVEELQFTGIQGKGNGYSTHLWIQVLPVLEVGGKDVKKLHIAVSSSTWKDCDVQFFDHNWSRFGSRDKMKERLSGITLIYEAKDGLGRNSTNDQDRRLSLLPSGAFQVTMPLVYGEGERAFIRLQEEIIRKTNDLTRFAWTIVGATIKQGPSKGEVLPIVGDRGVLAVTPRDFGNTTGLLHTNEVRNNPEFGVFIKGLRIHQEFYEISRDRLFMGLRCKQKKSHELGIILQHTGHGIYIRSRPERLENGPPRNSVASIKSIYISLT